MYKLYDYYRSSASYRVRVVLNYKGLEYTKQEVHLVNNGGEQHSEAYKLINQQELVPALEIPCNASGSSDAVPVVITQSLAIIDYLEEQHPEPSIYPDELLLKTQAKTLANLIACDTHPLNNLRVLKYLKSEFNVSEEQKLNWYHHWLKLSFDAYEKYLIIYNPTAKGRDKLKFSIGDKLSLADICLIPQVYNALRFELPMEDYLNITSIYENCLKLSYFDDAKPYGINT